MYIHSTSIVVRNQGKKLMNFKIACIVAEEIDNILKGCLKTGSLLNMVYKLTLANKAWAKNDDTGSDF